MIEGFMSKSLTPRVSPVADGIAVLGAFAVVPFAAQAANTNATGTLSGGAVHHDISDRLRTRDTLENKIGKRTRRLRRSRAETRGFDVPGVTI